jgi:hypothetical protein
MAERLFTVEGCMRVRLGASGAVFRHRTFGTESQSIRGVKPA